MALVTGSSSGIGQVIAIELAKAGYSIGITEYNNPDSSARETLKSVRRFTEGCIVKVNLEKKEGAKKLVKEVTEKLGPISLLINNAGNAQSGAVTDMNIWSQQFQNIFMTAIHSTSACLEEDKDLNDLKSIITITSLYGLINSADPEFIQYSCAKAALNSFTIALAKRLYPNTRVNAVAPGFVDTPAWKNVSQSEKLSCINTTLMKRFIDPQEVATAVRLLVENKAFNGEVMVIDGGGSLTPAVGRTYL